MMINEEITEKKKYNYCIANRKYKNLLTQF